jgi:predicted transcriptional regulator
MNPTREDIKARLEELQNLDAFAKASNIPRRTLMRIKNQEGGTEPRHTTLLLIDMALKKHRPKKKAPGEQQP